MNSHVANAIAQYSTSVVNLATIVCFLLFLDVRLLSMKTQFPEVYQRFEGKLQFAYEYPITWEPPLFSFNNLCPSTPSMYFKI